MTSCNNQIGQARAVSKRIALFLLFLPLVNLFGAESLVTSITKQPGAENPIVITLAPGVTGDQIQKALDTLPASGGEVLLPAGKISIRQPIMLHRDFQILRGSGAGTVLWLADDANCPVIIMGEPLNHPKDLISHLSVSDLAIDGNRQQQSRELWQLSGEGSDIRNNGITVQGVIDSSIEHVSAVRCRSGGLVTTRDCRRLTVRGFSSSDNQFDGLACYETEDSLFADLNLHDNPGAGISLDLAFNHNVISNAVLIANDLGIFMRYSHNNEFDDLSIKDCRHYGVFMADQAVPTAQGWTGAPRSECTHNGFTNLMAVDCGAAAFRVNDTTCTNNVIVQPKFNGNLMGGLSEARPDLISVR
jgi:hypothetical protein